MDHIGYWKSGEQNGYGEETTKDSNVTYQGNFKDEMKDGKGKMNFNNELEFVGDFIND